ncbi:hypothetical protein C8R44DRAFT_885376 [Mycena epipterygia]|nr:hypothetical protein C8R44DRAFT_885376 [Mycena epipterygia]
MPPPPVFAWTPQLRDYLDDCTVFEHQAFQKAFAEHAGGTLTRRRSKDLLNELNDTLSEAYWVQFLNDWLAFTLGGDIVAELPEDATTESRQLFLNVLWVRYANNGSPEGEDLARKLLLAAQAKCLKPTRKNATPKPAFKPYAQPPAEFCWHDDILQQEGHDDGDEDEWEDIPEDEPADEDDPMDGDYTDADPVDYSVDPDDTPSTTQTPETPLPNFIQTRAATARLVLQQVTPQSSAPPPSPSIWAAQVAQFFRPEFLHPMADHSGPRDVTDVKALKDSGLLDELHYVCRAGNLLETTHPDVEDSFRWYDWKTRYAELVVRWVAATMTLEEYAKTVPEPDPNYKFTLVEAQELLVFISSNPRMHPWSFDPMSVYLFLSLECFTINCNTWLVPCLSELNYTRLKGWKSAIVYHRLMALGVFLNPKANKLFIRKLDPRLAVIVCETSNHRETVRRVRSEVLRPNLPETTASSSSDAGDSSNDSGDSDSNPGESESECESEESMEDVQYQPRSPPKRQLPPRPSKSQKRAQRKKTRRMVEERANATGAGVRAKKGVLGVKNLAGHLGSVRRHTCPYCVGRPMKEQCVRIIYDRNRLGPKPPVKRKKGSKGTAPTRRVRYYHPFKDLQMQEVKFRRRVYKRCGKDITRLVWRRDGKGDEMVGGVRFKAFFKATLAQLVSNHRRVRVRAIRRQNAMQAWAYGSMTATGSRQPMGGYKGDGYGPYECHRGDTPDDIRALFRHAVDTDVLLEAAATIHPALKRDLGSTAGSGVKRFGRYGMSAFYCHNYISCIHADLDIALMAGYPPHSVFPRRFPLGWIPPLPYSAPLAFARAGLALLPRRPSTRPQHVPPPSRPSVPPLSRLHRASAPSSQRLLFQAATRPPPARQSRPRPARSALLPLHVAPYPYAPLSPLPVVPARCPRPPLPPLPPARLRLCAPATTLTKDLAKLVTIGLYLIRPSSTLYLTPWTIFWLSTPPFTENERRLALVFPASAFHAFVVQNVSRQPDALF